MGEKIFLFRVVFILKIVLLLFFKIVLLWFYCWFFSGKMLLIVIWVVEIIVLVFCCVEYKGGVNLRILFCGMVFFMMLCFSNVVVICVFIFLFGLKKMWLFWFVINFIVYKRFLLCMFFICGCLLRVVFYCVV